MSQKFLPPPKPGIVGIDLGTTYSCVGVYQAGTGKVKILENRDGDQCIPSVVAFSENDVVVGYKAQAIGSPDSTIYDAKRFIGKKFKKSELEKEASRYSFQMVADEYGQIRYKLVEKPKDIDTLVSPEFIGSRVIDNLKSTAEKALEKKVTLGVMSVPAEFNEDQRNATIHAAKIAGIDILRVINEPTAAALAYGLHKKPDISYVLVVDLGGGTLDVSLLNVQGGMFITMGMAGNNHLGGQDFNERLLQYLITQIKQKYKINTLDLSDINSLRMLVEKTKRVLSSEMTSKIVLPLKTLNGETFHFTIKREIFEDLISDLVKKVLEPIKRVIDFVKMEPEDIDEVVLVGGSTRTPSVRKLLAEFFGKKPNTSIDPELAVVSGVAVQAGVIGGAWPLQVSAVEARTSVRKIHIS
ncbi:DgyrCDS5023 [Dimorphilus gyrociliatus]|uniref:DgyrCDS5023 n=1 Tax=Dimorphilus gyrociliatus TaxID=2664684 RepID=A0A7I8VKX7_9ANNE|nr:DgyrCDS5023 [Dimorphilus gyrociliatus]